MNEITNRPILQRYECTMMFYVVKNTKAPEIIYRIKQLLDADTQESKILHIEDWGKRSIAFKINGSAVAHYIMIVFQCKSETCSRVKRLIDESYEHIMRHLIIRMDKGLKSDYHSALEDQAKTAILLKQLLVQH